MERKVITRISVLAVALLLLLTACGGSAQQKRGDLLTIIPPVDLTGLSDMPETGILRVGTMEPFAALNQTNGIFKDKFPGWQIEFIQQQDNVGSMADDDGLFAFYYQYIPEWVENEAELDVLHLEYANKDIMIERGLLEDLVPWMAQDEELTLNKLLPGIVNVMAYDNAVYSLPVSFSIYCIQMPREDAFFRDLLTEIPKPWTWDAMIDFLTPEIKRNNLSYLLVGPPQDLTNELLTQYKTYFYDEETNTYDFNSPVFIYLMDTVKKLNDNHLLWAHDLVPTDGSEAAKALGSTFPLGNEVRDYSDYEDNLAYRSNLFGYMLSNPTIPGTEGKYARLYNEMGILADSPNKRAAWEYLKILFSDEIQNSAQLGREPVVADFSMESAQEALGNITETELMEYNHERFDFYADINRTSKRVYPNPNETITRHLLRYYLNEVSQAEVIEDLHKEMNTAISPSD